ncbi:unnamed protein product [Urochloa humidicola]
MERTAGAGAARGLILPDHLVVWEILVRLPAKVLLRCRAVCRSWRRLTSASVFLLAHHQRQPSLPLVCFDGMIRGHSDVANAAVEAFHLRGAPTTAERRPVLRFNDSACRRTFQVHASCDGLLLLSISSGGLYICNPGTRQWNAVPSVARADVAGLFRHTLSGEYRILYRRRYAHPVLHSAFYLLTVGFSGEARCIGLPLASHSIKEYISSGMWYAIHQCPPVLHCNCLHWVLHSSMEKALIVFDTIAESFRQMCSPATANLLSSAHLFGMDGRLAFSKLNESKVVVEVWVLQDYETEVWSFKYQIRLPIAEMRMDSRFDVMVVSGKGDVLVNSSSSCHLFHCDSKGKLVQKFKWNSVHPRRIGLWFKESLVKHEFFQEQDGDHVVQPPFFRGFF